jgi:hypothetical protein
VVATLSNTAHHVQAVLASSAAAWVGCTAAYLILTLPRLGIPRKVPPVSLLRHRFGYGINLVAPVA